MPVAIVAGALLVPDETTHVWRLPLAELSTHPLVYPGAMPVYTSVVTSGLSMKDAKGYAGLLRFVAGAGQTPGLEIGQLPPGFVSLNGSSALKPLTAYALRAADAVEQQVGSVPTLAVPLPSAAPAPSATSQPAATQAPQPVVARGVDVLTPTTPNVLPQPAPVLTAAPVLAAASARLTPLPLIGATGSSGVAYLPALVLVCLGAGLASAFAARATRASS